MKYIYIDHIYLSICITHVYKWNEKLGPEAMHDSFKECGDYSKSRKLTGISTGGH